MDPKVKSALIEKIKAAIMEEREERKQKSLNKDRCISGVPECRGTKNTQAREANT
ncbi:MAG: hypothetical protein HY232_11890 [Acidobacteria bacterium]|nr:hypothetical protein [Acidobacteriota bacterium]